VHVYVSIIENLYFIFLLLFLLQRGIIKVSGEPVVLVADHDGQEVNFSFS
jgi:hypothetical protein